MKHEWFFGEWQLLLSISLESEQNIFDFHYNKEFSLLTGDFREAYNHINFQREKPWKGNSSFCGRSKESRGWCDTVSGGR